MPHNAACATSHSQVESTAVLDLTSTSSFSAVSSSAVQSSSPTQTSSRSSSRTASQRQTAVGSVPSEVGGARRIAVGRVGVTIFTLFWGIWWWLVR